MESQYDYCYHDFDHCSMVTNMNKKVSMTMKLGEGILLEFDFNSFKFDKESIKKELIPSQIKQDKIDKVE